MVVLNGQNFSWTKVHAGFPQRSIVDPLYKLRIIYINDLPDNFASNAKRFADDISLPSVVHDVNTCAKASVANQRDRTTHLYFSTIIMSLKSFSNNTWVSY